MSGALRIAVVLAAAAAAAFVASFMLLGVATGHDPVGRLTPQGAHIARSSVPGPHPPPPAPLPQPPSHEHEHADD
jgi:hypothetical protein